MMKTLILLLVSSLSWAQQKSADEIERLKPYISPIPTVESLEFKGQRPVYKSVRGFAPFATTTKFYELQAHPQQEITAEQASEARTYLRAVGDALGAHNFQRMKGYATKDELHEWQSGLLNAAHVVLRFEKIEHVISVETQRPGLRENEITRVLRILPSDSTPVGKLAQFWQEMGGAILFEPSTLIENGDVIVHTQTQFRPKKAIGGGDMGVARWKRELTVPLSLLINPKNVSDLKGLIHHVVRDIELDRNYGPHELDILASGQQRIPITTKYLSDYSEMELGKKLPNGDGPFASPWEKDLLLSSTTFNLEGLLQVLHAMTQTNERPSVSLSTLMAQMENFELGLKGWMRTLAHAQAVLDLADQPFGSDIEDAPYLWQEADGHKWVRFFMRPLLRDPTNPHTPPKQQWVFYRMRVVGDEADAASIVRHRLEMARAHVSDQLVLAQFTRDFLQLHWPNYYVKNSGHYFRQLRALERVLRVPQSRVYSPQARPITRAEVDADFDKALKAISKQDQATSHTYPQIIESCEGHIF